MKTKRTMATSLREFLLDGTVVEWALGWVLGEVISRFLLSLMHDFLIPIFEGAVLGGVSISELNFSISGIDVYYGSLIESTIDMVIIIFVLFLIVELILIMRKKHNLEEEDELEPLVQASENNASLLREIRDLLAQQQSSQQSAQQNSKQQE